MPEHIPAGRVVLRERQAVLPAELAPDALGVRAQPVHDDRGVGIAFMQDRAVLPDEFQQRGQAECRQLDIGRWELRIVDAAKVGVRKPAVPGHGVNAAHPAHGAQRDDGVDRGQAGPQDDHPCFGAAVEVRQPVLPGLPRIAHPRRMIVEGLGAGQRCRRLIPGGQDDAVGFKCRSVGKPDQAPGRMRLDVDRLAEDELRGGSAPCTRAFQMVLHDGPQVVAINLAGCEVLT